MKMKLSQVLQVLNLATSEQKDNSIYLEFADKDIDGIFGANIPLTNKWAHKIDVLKINIGRNTQLDLLCDFSGFIVNNRADMNKAVKKVYTAQYLQGNIQFCDGSSIRALDWLTDDNTYPDKSGEKFAGLIADAVMYMLEL